MYKCTVCGKPSNGPFCKTCGSACVKEEMMGSNYGGKKKSVAFDETERSEIVKVTADKSKKRARFLRDLLISLSIAVVLLVTGFFLYRNYNEKLEEEVNTAVNLAEDYFEKRDFEMTLKHLDSVKENKYYEKNKQAHLLEGKSYMELEKYENAAECFEKALEIESDDEAILNLAVCYVRLEKTKKALDVIKETKNKKDAKSYIEGEIYLRRGEYEEAEASFRNVVDITNDEGLKRNAYIALSNLYKERRHEDTEDFTNLNMQIDVLEEAVRELKAEDDIVITEMMGEAYFTAKKYDLALNKFGRLLELGYERAYIYRNIAIIHQQTGNLEKAEETLKEMREKYPEDYSCYEQFAYLYLDIESKKQQSQRDYSKVVKNYELAKKYVDSQNESELIPLEKAIEELKQKGWL